jgi:hypothetical protein
MVTNGEKMAINERKVEQISRRPLLLSLARTAISDNEHWRNKEISLFRFDDSVMLEFSWIKYILTSAFQN